MSQLLSPKQVAQAIGVSESSVKRWCDQGTIKTVKTAGGHRRISVAEALHFVREHQHTVVEPLILSLPPTTDRKVRRIEGASQRLMESLLEGNEAACHAMIFDLFLAGETLSRIFDDVIAVAFREIGTKWHSNQAEIYQERSSCQIALRLMHELRSKQISPDTGCMALVATIEGDQYSLPVTMSEIVIRSAGWNAQLLGSSIPLSSISKALQQRKPGLLCLSISNLENPREFITQFNHMFAAAQQEQTAVVVGGRALTLEIRTQLRYSAFCDTMQQLEEFALTLLRHSSPNSDELLKRPKKA